MVEPNLGEEKVMEATQMFASNRFALLLLVLLGVAASRVAAGEMQLVRVSDDKHGFVLEKSGRSFVPWGFNYDHDEIGRLLEDYWDKEWPKVEEDFPKMKDLGANVVRIYPEKDKVTETMETLSAFAVGKPVVIEEMFPLNCSFPEFERFLDGSRKTASGWIGFYWGRTPEENRKSNTVEDALMVRWLEIFQKRASRNESPMENKRVPAPVPPFFGDNFYYDAGMAALFASI